LLAGDIASANRFVGHDSLITGAEVSARGDLLAASARGGQVRVWRHPLAGPMPEAAMAGEPRWMRFSPCGKFLAILARMPDFSGRLFVHDTTTGDRLWETALPHTRYPAAKPDFFTQWYPAFDRSGQTIAIHEPRGGIGLREARTGATLHHFDIETTFTDQFCFFPDGRELGVQDDSRIRIVLLADGKQQRQVGGPGKLSYVEHSGPDLVWCERDLEHGYILHQGSTSEPPRAIVQAPRELVAPAMSRDARCLAAADYRLNVFVWDLHGNASPRRLIAPDRIVELQFVDEGQTLVGMGASGTVTFWHLATRSELLRLGSASERIRCLAVHPRQQMLVLGVETERGYALRVHRLTAAGERLAAAFDVSQPPADQTASDPPTQQKH
jgi:WD40 repeat protein